MPILQDIKDALNIAGIRAFGLAMPVLSPGWTDADVTMLTVDDAQMKLSLDDAGTWLAPAAGTLRIVNSDSFGVTLVSADGSPLLDSGLLLTLFPQVRLRLARLYAQVFEASDQGLPLRPVPCFFFYNCTILEILEASAGGNVNPGDPICNGGELMIFDENGMPVDPLAVAAAFYAFMVKHNLLQLRAGGAHFNSDPQVRQIAELTDETYTVRVRLSDHAGKPYDGTHLNGLTAVNDLENSLFTLNAASGIGSDLTGSIAKEAASYDFPDEERRLLLLGPATTGRLADEFTPPALPVGTTAPVRDFFSIRVVQLKEFLLGNPNVDFNGAAAELKPAIRINEQLTLLADGNDVLAAANAALSGTTQESLCVAQAISGNFDVPSAIGADAHWPNFPSTDDTPAIEGKLPIGLRDSFSPTANYFDGGTTANVDVVLTLNSLPAGAAVRVYPRKFVADAREERGDGAGGVVPESGTLTLLLKDPFTLRRPGLDEDVISIPSQPTLRCDVMIVKRTGEARLYGNVEVTVNAAAGSSLPTMGANPFGNAKRRGVSNAGVLGLGKHTLTDPPPTASDEEKLLTIIQQLTGETNPRDAPRLPTMARRDLLVAGLLDGNWRGVIAGGRLTEETHSADARLGAPGGRGGRETQVVGAATQDGCLAYDIARMAFRRTTNIVTRMIDLVSNNWNEPVQPAASNGTFAGAVLQTIAPWCETPELSLLKPLVDNNPDSIPGNFDDLVDWLGERVEELVPVFSGNMFLNNIISRIRTEIINALNNLKDDDTLDQSTLEHMFEEIHRELMASCYGRRDAQWALAGAISRARRFIYIESPGFAATQKDYGDDPVPPYAKDLIQMISTRLGEAPGLHVIICTPKFPDFAAGYEGFSAYEAANRRAHIIGLPAERVVSFHPVGFPGRPSRLESSVVIVDDVWAMIGSSTFRRRGLTFDGGSDLVFTDTNLINGRSAAITTFRRQLLANRLGIQTNSFGTMPDPNFVRLHDGVEAFYVIREMLVAGGLGKIDRLWNGKIPGVEPITPSDIDIANPEGLEFNLLDTLLISAIAALNSF